MRKTWPLWMTGLTIFAAVGFAPTLLAFGQPRSFPSVEVAALDPEVEQLTRYLEWRAPVALEPTLRRSIAQVVVEESRRVGLDPLYILSVMEVESDFLPDAHSNMEAHGLLQLRAITLKEISRHEVLPPSSATEPELLVHVRLGIRYLARLEKRFPNREQALAAWNAGPTAVAKALSTKGTVPDRWLFFSRNVMREHSRLRLHLGVDPLPGVAAHLDGEAATALAD